MFLSQSNGLTKVCAMQPEIGSNVFRIKNINISNKSINLILKIISNRIKSTFHFNSNSILNVQRIHTHTHTQNNSNIYLRMLRSLIFAMCIRVEHFRLTSELYTENSATEKKKRFNKFKMFHCLPFHTFYYCFLFFVFK